MVSCVFVLELMPVGHGSDAIYKLHGAIRPLSPPCGYFYQHVSFTVAGF